MSERGSNSASDGALYVVATPIGNLGDLSPRAIETLSRVAWIAAEDTRRTQKLKSRFGWSTRLVSVHEHTPPGRLEPLIASLKAGEEGALVSDAGTPLLSDPGVTLVTAASAAGVRVVPIPGPSAIHAALMVAGYKVTPYTFFGFPPRREGEQREFWAETLKIAHALVLFIPPHGLVRSLELLTDSDRPILLARELTKSFEEIKRGTARELLTEFRDRAIKGEITLVIGPRPERSPVGLGSSVQARISELKREGLSARDCIRVLQSEGFRDSKRTMFKLYTDAE